MKSSSQPAGRGRERGHFFHLSLMTWKYPMSLLLISHGPELRDVAIPGSKGEDLRRGLSVFHLGWLAWKHTGRLSLHQHPFLCADYEAKTICDFRPFLPWAGVWEELLPSFYTSREQHGHKIWCPIFLDLNFFFIQRKVHIQTRVHAVTTQIIQGKKYQVLERRPLAWGGGGGEGELEPEGPSLCEESDMLRSAQ